MKQTKKTGEISIPAFIPESEVEVAALEILSELGYDYLYGPDIAPETEDAGRDDFGTVILPRRLRAAIDILNPGIPAGAGEEAIKKVLREESQDLVHNNLSFHNMLVNGIELSIRGRTGKPFMIRSGFLTFQSLRKMNFLR
ncbi:type I restriction endonuclease [Methanosarcina sp.]|uniref:type I restriction endonuclease n=1 Tax=Methanosarcina sp. TaxID=2213 RepID=UPI003C706314